MTNPLYRILAVALEADIEGRPAPLVAVLTSAGAAAGICRMGDRPETVLAAFDRAARGEPPVLSDVSHGPEPTVGPRRFAHTGLVDAVFAAVGAGHATPMDVSRATGREYRATLDAMRYLWRHGRLLRVAKGVYAVPEEVAA